MTLGIAVAAPLGAPLLLSMRHVASGIPEAAEPLPGRQRPGFRKTNGVRAATLAGTPTLRSSVSVPPDLYTDQRITRIGDIVTVIISINDKAKFGNTTDRSNTARRTFMVVRIHPSDSRVLVFVGSTGEHAVTTSIPLPAPRAGDINRSEQIQVSVPAVVTQVLTNGNLMIHGSRRCGSTSRFVSSPSPASCTPRHLTHQHDRLRPGRRGANFLRRGGSALRGSAARLGSADLRFSQTFLTSLERHEL